MKGLMKIIWNWYNWSLSRQKAEGDTRVFDQLFALKCGLCNRFTLGCKCHYFCGLCEPCRHEVEDV